MTQQSASFQDSPSSNHAPVLTDRSSKNFYVTPMGKGRHASLAKHCEAEDETESGIGFSILGSVLGGALGLGPMFEVGFESVKAAIEINEGMHGAQSFVQDVNLNPAALLRPELAFNFKAFELNQKPPIGSSNASDRSEQTALAKKRSWNSGEGDFLLASRMAEGRRRSMAANPVAPIRGLSPSDKLSLAGSRSGR